MRKTLCLRGWATNLSLDLAFDIWLNRGVQWHDIDPSSLESQSPRMLPWHSGRARVIQTPEATITLSS